MYQLWNIHKARPASKPMSFAECVRAAKDRHIVVPVS